MRHMHCSRATLNTHEKTLMISFECTKLERQQISKIAKRAAALGVTEAPLDLEMDITAVHVNTNALDLEKLMNFPDADFLHDIYGIAWFVDRGTGELTDFFSPRCSLPQHSTK